MQLVSNERSEVLKMGAVSCPLSTNRWSSASPLFVSFAARCWFVCRPDQADPVRTIKTAMTDDRLIDHLWPRAPDSNVHGFAYDETLS